MEKILNFSLYFFNYIITLKTKPFTACTVYSHEEIKNPKPFDYKEEHIFR